MNADLHAALTSITATLAAVGWFVGLRPGADDADTEACHEFVLDSLSNADAVRTVEAITDKNLRSQLTVEQAMQLHEEAKLSKMGARRN